MPRTITAIPAAAAIAALLLAGCVGAGPELAVVVPTDPIEVPVSPSPEPTEEQETVTLPENAEPGLEIPESLAQELNRDVSDGLRGYRMPDGTWLLVKGNEPLPEAVIVDAERQAAELPVITASDVQSQVDAINSIEGAQSNLAFQTGKRVVLIAYGTLVYTDPIRTGVGWHAAGSPLVGLKYPRGENVDAVRGEVEGLIALQENPDEWVIIVQPR